MKRVARILGVVGGIGALVWAMRERLLSVAIPREPEPPAFRVPSIAPVATGSITDITGIGPVYATRLGARDINTVGDLASSSPDDVAEAAQVPITRAVEWVNAARAIH